MGFRNEWTYNQRRPESQGLGIGEMIASHNSWRKIWSHFVVIHERQRWIVTNIWEAARQYLSTSHRDWGFQDTHLSFVRVGRWPKVLQHYRDMAQECQITVQIEESQSPVKPAAPTPLYFGDECEAIFVEENSCPYRRYELKMKCWSNVQTATRLKYWCRSLTARGEN
jgi:hypothetical protein